MLKLWQLLKLGVVFLEILKDYLIIREGNLSCVPHINPELEIVMVNKGSVSVQYDDKTVVVEEGQAAVILPYRLHGVTCPQETEAFVLMFSYSLVGDFYDNYKAVELKKYVFDLNKELKEYLRPMIEQAKNSADIFTVKALFYPIVCAYLKDNEANVSRKNSSSDIRKIVEYIAEKSAEEITMDDVADATCIVKEKIGTLLKERTGRSFNDFLNIVRLEKARRIIEFTDQSISEIAYYCGFGSLRNFNRVYRKVFGDPPSSKRAKR